VRQARTAQIPKLIVRVRFSSPVSVALSPGRRNTVLPTARTMPPAPTWKRARPADETNRVTTGSDPPGRAEPNRGPRSRPRPPCPLRARSAGQRGQPTVAPGQPDTPAHLRMGRLTRCVNRPSKQRVTHTAGSALGATLGATRTNNLGMPRTHVDNREAQARGHGLI
jgi:hypothetical protein